VKSEKVIPKDKSPGILLGCRDSSCILQNARTLFSVAFCKILRSPFKNSPPEHFFTASNPFAIPYAKRKERNKSSLFFLSFMDLIDASAKTLIFQGVSGFFDCFFGISEVFRSCLLIFEQKWI